MNNATLLELVMEASLVVQGVMIILLIMSIMAWAITFAKSAQLKRAKKATNEFEETFWSSHDLTLLYNQVSLNLEGNQGTQSIFESGFKEFVNLKKQGVKESTDLVSGVQRAMKVTFSNEAERLEQTTPILATIGSSAPYIGLFGTVWGIMNAFIALGEMPNATLAAVAPGIAEALIATALGLFAAIPAVIAYNQLMTKTNKIVTDYENFAEGFLTIIQRQSHSIKD